MKSLFNCFFILLCLVLSMQTLLFAEVDLLAYYKFDKIIDNSTPDNSGNDNPAAVVGPTLVGKGEISGLLFDGVDDYVDCGSKLGTNLKDEVTIECIVRPDDVRDDELGIAGKGTTFGLTYYKGSVYWYTAGAGIYSINAPLTIGEWQHIAATYDGKTSVLFINGEKVASREYNNPISKEGNFYVGSIGVKSKVFPGAIGSVRLYSKALSPKEVAARLVELKMKGVTSVESTEAVKDGLTLTGKTYKLRVSSKGALQLEIGKDRYNIESQFSYPGASISWNNFGKTSDSQDKQWIPKTSKEKDGSISINAQCKLYSVKRNVVLDGHRIIVSDTLTNTSSEDVGIIYKNLISSPQTFIEQLLAGAPKTGYALNNENPSVYQALKNSKLVWLAEDTILRLQFVTSMYPRGTSINVNRFALQPGKSYTFKWDLYPLQKNQDYWTFVNQVRKDWDVPFKNIGPMQYLDITSSADLINNPEKLKAYLTRNQAKVIAMLSWLDYDNFNYLTSKPSTRSEYKVLFKNAADAIKKVDPSIKCIGCIEANWVSLPEEARAAMAKTVVGKPSEQYPFTSEQSEIIKNLNLQWNDCLLQNEQGKNRYELYYRGPKSNPFPMIAIGVYAALNNGQHKYWLDQAKFLIEDVGLDGLYIDQFNLAFDDAQRYSYKGWDGHTVNIDSSTGQITKRYVDGALVSIPAQKSLADYVVSHGKYMLANTFPSDSTMQNERIHRFNESEWYFDVYSWPDGTEPPLSFGPCKGHFSTPIGLGFRTERYGETGKQEYAKIIMKGAMTYLRHGLLYYHYMTEIPETGPGAGEYGPINKMFPITPLELHKGWVKGTDRIVSCVKYDTLYEKDSKPIFYFYDDWGREIKVTSDSKGDKTLYKTESGDLKATCIKKKNNQWQIIMNVKDWLEFGIVE